MTFKKITSRSHLKKKFFYRTQHRWYFLTGVSKSFQVENGTRKFFTSSNFTYPRSIRLIFITEIFFKNQLDSSFSFTSIGEITKKNQQHVSLLPTFFSFSLSLILWWRSVRSPNRIRCFYSLISTVFIQHMNLVFAFSHSCVIREWWTFLTKSWIDFC